MPSTKRYVCTDDVRVIYEGSKSFWRLRLAIDIYIVKHSAFQVLELICFNPQTSIESHRIYIQILSLSQAIDAEEIENKVNERKEYLHRQKKEIEYNSVLETVLEDLMVSYLTARVNVLDQSEPLNIIVTEKIGHYLPSMASFVCDKPPNLKPFEIVHQILVTLAFIDSVAIFLANLISVGPTNFKRRCKSFAKKHERRSPITVKLSTPFVRGWA